MSNGRKANGRFAPGNSGGPGRPRRAVEHNYLTVISDAVSLDDWRTVVVRAVADARKGDARARDWLAKHLVGDQTTVDVLHEMAPQIILQIPDNGRGPKRASSEV